jgi:organic hydroperoxide reductase OsmC/OhrA
VTTHVARNEAGKFRINAIDVELLPEVVQTDGAKLHRCEGLFEDFCIVTESVRRGIPVNVTVKQPDAASVEAA